MCCLDQKSIPEGHMLFRSGNYNFPSRSLHLPPLPGSLTKQYRDPKARRLPFYQLSYTYRMRSRSEYVRKENLSALRKETANFKRFKKLIDRWIDLALKASRMRVREAAKTHHVTT